MPPPPPRFIGEQEHRVRPRPPVAVIAQEWTRGTVEQVSTGTATRRRSGWAPGRIALVVGGSLLALIGLAVLAGGAFLL
jgi:hypothetical protein